MKKGILYSILYYSFCLGLSAVVHVLQGEDQGHAPSLSSVIMFLTFVGGALWCVLAVVGYLARWSSRQLLLGTVPINLLASLLFLGYAIWEIKRTQEYTTETSTNKMELRHRGDTIEVYYDGQPVYYQTGDTVRFNFLDSARMDSLRQMLRDKRPNE